MNSVNNNGSRTRKYPRLIYPAGLVAFSVAALLALIPCVLLAFKDYSVAHGFKGSAWVGLYNFKRTFASATTGALIRESLYLKIIELALGYLPGVALAALSTLPHKRGVRAALGGAFLTLGCMPYAALYALYAAAGGGTPAQGDNFGIGALYALVACPRIIGVTAFVGALMAALGERPLRGVAQGALIIAPLMLMSALTPSLPAALLLNRAGAPIETIDIKIYELGLIGKGVSDMATLYCVKLLCQLPVALVAAMALARLLGGEGLRAQVRVGARDSGWMVSPMALPLAICAAFGLACARIGAEAVGAFDGKWLEINAPALYSSLIMALSGAALALLLTLALRAATAGRSGKIYALGAVTLMCMSYPAAYLYLLARFVGCADSPISAALCSVSRADALLPVFAICALGFSIDMRASSRYAPAFIAALVTMAIAWGDCAGPALMHSSAKSIGGALMSAAQTQGSAPELFWTALPALLLGACAAGWTGKMFSERD